MLISYFANHGVALFAKAYRSPEAISRMCTLRKEEENVTLLEEDTPISKYFFLCSGSVKVCGPGKEERVVGAGRGIGEEALLSLCDTTRKVVTLEPTILLVFEKDDFLDLTMRNREALARFRLEFDPVGGHLEDILHIKLAKRAFIRHLQVQAVLSDQHLMEFWLAVEAYERCFQRGVPGSNTLDLQQLSTQIIGAFFLPNSPKVLGIPDDVKNKVLDDASKGRLSGYELFLKAKLKAMDALEKDSFDKFRGGHLYARALRQLHIPLRTDNATIQGSGSQGSGSRGSPTAASRRRKYFEPQVSLDPDLVEVDKTTTILNGSSPMNRDLSDTTDLVLSRLLAAQAAGEDARNTGSSDRSTKSNDSLTSGSMASYSYESLLLTSNAILEEP